MISGHGTRARNQGTEPGHVAEPQRRTTAPGTGAETKSKTSAADAAKKANRFFAVSGASCVARHIAYTHGHTRACTGHTAAGRTDVFAMQQPAAASDGLTLSSAIFRATAKSGALHGFHLECDPAHAFRAEILLRPSTWRAEPTSACMADDNASSRRLRGSCG